MNEESTFLCAGCGERHPNFLRREFAGLNYCESCLDEETFVCTRCGGRFRNDDNAGNVDTPLCQDCYNNHYSICARCGAIIPNSEVYYVDGDDEDSYCYDCYYHFRNNNVIHEYYYKPEPIFYGSGPRFFGVELEVDEGGETSTKAEDIESTANYDGKERCTSSTMVHWMMALSWCHIPCLWTIT